MLSLTGQPGVEANQARISTQGLWVFVALRSDVILEGIKCVAEQGGNVYFESLANGFQFAQ